MSEAEKEWTHATTQNLLFQGQLHSQIPPHVTIEGMWSGPDGTVPGAQIVCRRKRSLMLAVWSSQEDCHFRWGDFCDPLKKHFVRGRPLLQYRIALLCESGADFNSICERHSKLLMSCDLAANTA